MARASLAALMSLVPILDMTLHPLPILPNDISKNALQLVPLRFAQVRFLSLGINRQQKHRHLFAGIKRDHAIPTALSFTATRNANFAGAASATDFVTSFRAVRDHLDHPLPFAFRQAGGLGVSEIGRRLDDRMHR